MQNNSNDFQLLDNLECPICIDYFDIPMECLSCNNVFCKKCLDDSNKYKI